jgi:iron complex outermembrane recepter protein
MRFRRLLRFAVVCWLACEAALGGRLLAQTAADSGAGTISGTITDPSGALVAGAKIEATNDANGKKSSASSDGYGQFQIENLKGGTYTVEVEARGFQTYRAENVVVSKGGVTTLVIKTTVETARKVVVVNGGPADDYVPAAAMIGNLQNLPVAQLPVSAFVVTRSVIDDQQSRLLTEVASNDASVGEDYAPVGWYEDFQIRGFPIDLASGIKINGLAAAGEQIFALENKESVEFLKGVDGAETGVASGGGLINFVTKRPADVRSITVATDHRGSAYGAGDFGGFLGSTQQFGWRTNLASERLQSYVHGANGWRAFGALAADWKINKSTYLKGDFDYQHLVQRSVGGYQLLGGTTVPTDVSPGVMLGYQSWAKPNTYDDFNTSLRLDHTFSSNWRAFAAGSWSHTLLDDNIAYPYGCYYQAVCNTGSTPPPYFFAPNGDYDVYDYRSPGEVRINDQFEAILSGRVKTGWVTNDVAIGTSLQRRSVNLPNAVFDYVGTENIYLTEVAFSPSPNEPGPSYLAEDTHQYALILEDHIHLPYRFDVTVGAQYDTLHDFLYPDQSRWLPQYSVSWRPVSDLMLYANYSVALSLGLQGPFWATVNPNAFLAPFITRQVEGGVKYEPGKKILLTAAVYRMKAPFFYPKVLDSAGDTEFVSDGHERHSGIELSAQGKATNWLRITGSTALLRAISDGSTTPDFNGKQVIDVPRFRMSLFADVDVPFISGLHFLPGWSYTSAKEATRDDSVSVPGYNLVNLGASYTPHGEWSKVTFHLFAENALNKRYWKDTGASLGDTFLHLGAPATVRLSAQYNF